MQKKIGSIISQSTNFITTDIWRIRVQNTGKVNSFLIKYLRIILMAIRGFRKNHCPLRASALTFYSILSIVPVFAMAFGIAKGFGVEKILEKRLIENFPGQEDVMVQVIGFANKMLENTKGGLIAGIGVAILFWTVIKVMGHIETSLNSIWEIKTPRTIGRKLSDYLALMITAPILIIISGSVTVFIQTQIILITQKIALLGMFSSLIFFGLKFLPYTLIWILFTMIYMIMPNTKIKFSSGVLAGIVAGTIYQMAQWGYIHFQVGVANHNAIYGSFAALPLFLVWLQVSWIIVLFGAAISAAHQNADNYEFEPDSMRVSPWFKRLASLQTAKLLIQNFSKGKPPLTTKQISNQLDIPFRLVQNILNDLTQCGILTHTKTEQSDENAYQPGIDINLLTIKYIINALNHKGIDDLPISNTEEFKTLVKTLNTIHEADNPSQADMLIKDI